MAAQCPGAWAAEAWFAHPHLYLPLAKSLRCGWLTGTHVCFARCSASHAWRVRSRFPRPGSIRSRSGSGSALAAALGLPAARVCATRNRSIKKCKARKPAARCMCCLCSLAVACAGGYGGGGGGSGPPSDMELQQLLSKRCAALPFNIFCHASVGDIEDTSFSLRPWCVLTGRSLDVPVTTTRRIVFATTCACVASGWTTAQRHGNQTMAEAAPSTAAVAVRVQSFASC